MRGRVIGDAALLVLGVAGCGERYERPCRVGQEHTVVGEAMLQGVESREDLGGGVTVTWMDPSPTDAGTEAPRGRVVVVSADGALLAEHSFAAPAALAARKGSTEGIGISFTGDVALFHWIEATTATDPNGEEKRSARLVVQRTALDGREIDPGLVVASCDRCRMTASYAAIAGAAGVLLQQLAASPGGASLTRLLSFDRAGTFVRETELLAAPASPDAGAVAGGDPSVPPGSLGVDAGVGTGGATPGAALEGRRDRFVARFGRRATIFGADGIAREQLELPVGAGHAIDVDGPSVVMGWTSVSTVSATNVLFERRGSGLGPRRISSGAAVTAVRISGSRVGILLGGTTSFFALVDGDAKVGGDHEIATNVGFSPRRILAASDADRFVAWSLGRGLVRQEIVCAP